MKSSWLNITSEADKLAEIHNELQIRLVNQVHGNVQKWKSANYHKSLLSWKETKTAEEGFSKAQKPWAKRQDEGNNDNDNDNDNNNDNDNLIMIIIMITIIIIIIIIIIKHQESIRESYYDRDSKDLHAGICANPQKGAQCVNRMIDLSD